MKLKKFIFFGLLITIFALAVSGALAMPKKGIGNSGGMPPGLLKKMILETASSEEAVDLIINNAGSLPPGILKEVILALDLSNDSLERLEQVGMLDGLPPGIYKEISAGNDEVTEIEVEGYIEDLDLIGTCHITVDEITYLISEEVEILLDEEEATLEDLEVGMEATIVIVDEEVIQICAESIDYEEVEGNIEDLDLIGTYHITIDEVSYKIAEEVEVILDEEEATLADLVVGMAAKIEIVDEEVIQICAESIDYEEVEGNIEDLDLIGTYHITIDEVEYELSRDARVVINGISKALEDLEIGMSVVLDIEEDVVVEVNVEYVIEVVEGNITNIDLEDNYIVIDGEEYKIAEEVEIRLNNEDAILEDLEVGLKINATVLNGEITEINAFEEEIIEGQISAIDLEDKCIVIGGVEYQLSSDAIVKVDGEDATLEDLTVGMFVEAELINEEITKLLATIIETNTIEGVITDLDLIGIYHLSVDNHEYNLLRTAIVTLNEKEADLADLQLGMSVIVILIDDEIIEIEATLINRETVLGEIKEIDLVGTYHLQISSEEYLLSTEALVTIDGSEAELDELEIGMEAIVLIEDEVVTRIDALSSEFIQVNGVLTNIDIDESNIEIDHVMYSLSDDVEVLIDDEEATLAYLVVEMDVEIELDNGLVVTINGISIEQNEVQEVQGVFMAFDSVDGTITIDDKEYLVAEDIETIIVNGEAALLEDLVVYMNVEVELHNNIVTKIAAEDNVVQINGEIIGVSFTTAGMKVTIELDDDETAEYAVSEDLYGGSAEPFNLGDYAQFTLENYIIVEVNITN